MKRLIRLAALGAGLTIAVPGCSLESASQSSGNVVNVVIGYQSKTINTVTAGTLLRAQGYLERRHRHQVQRELAGLRHRSADHRADGRREDRHRFDGRLPDADQRVQDPGERTRPYRNRLGHRL